ncbi:MAG: peptidyl-prolyl cis-trans isomerase [Polyangiaceae bacterium]|nr:peptidyl-prolyl cis-trans isomerase [Polyangiaceae bacterium]
MRSSLLSISRLATVVPAIALAAVTLFLGCSSGSTKPTPPSASPTVVARVGSLTIDRAALERAMKATGLSREAALTALVEDTLLYGEALSTGTTAAQKQLERANLASAVGFAIRDHAREQGAITEADLEGMSKDRWKEVDVPESVRVVHAIVLRPKKEDKFAKAVELATKLHDRVAIASSPEEFESLGRSFPAEKGFETRIEKLPPFALSGAVVDRGANSSMDEVFSKAAHALTKAGDTSAVIETPFGWHTIRLVERIPGHAMPMDQRRTLLAPAVVDWRASRERMAILEKQELKKVDLAPQAEDWVKPLLLLAASNEAVSP